MLDLHGYGWTILEGARLTLASALLSVVLAVLIGIAVALLRLSHSRIASGAALTYTTVIRGIPDLVLMLLIFFGGQILVNKLVAWVDPWIEAQGGAPIGYLDINPFIAGVLTLAVIYGAYMAETFRGAILAVPHGQLESARAFGMTPFQVFRRVLFPQAVRHALPGITNNWLVLLKSTALLSVIGLEDMVRKAQFAVGATRLPFTFYLFVAVLFLLFTTASLLVLRTLEARAQRPYR
ncbi:MAG TPA: ABC transporter permease [Geminicoccus sp.]|uniref:ABC transporter permease n=1 Tax=Geminicoccus sp. TaxID=2024832 RepID=UPI002C2EF8B5|nr:ABC transporter permease [Geminicoccus sp.]HWL71499.1 ABC transporter permease [Geminicoccus sp.]